MPKLVLFDVDGILLEDKSIGATSIILEKHFGIKPFKTNYDAFGKTFLKILHDRLEEAGVKNPEKHPNFQKALYDTSPISDYLKNGGKFERIPCVEKLIAMLLKNGCIIGLLTGNSKNSAKLKLESIGLWNYFRIGAFGSEAKERSQLVPLAVKDALGKTGIKFKKKEVFLIGDTPEDIRCARKARVKIISVATGLKQLSELKAGKPDFLFKDFSNCKLILEAIKGKA